MKKWELALLVAVAATVLYCAMPLPRWWTAAFSPLCDGILTGEADGAGLVLRSRLWELVTNALS